MNSFVRLCLRGDVEVAGICYVKIQLIFLSEPLEMIAMKKDCIVHE